VRITTSPVLIPIRTSTPAPAQIVVGGESGVDRALRMVLVRDRRAEQGENAIAGRLNDVAVVPMDCVDHQLERGVDNRARLFGVEIRHQLGRTLDVGEQRGDRLALTIDCLAPGCFRCNAYLRGRGIG
jgi:hypothetical protein